MQDSPPGSLIYVGSIPGSLLWGWLPVKLGRKPALMLLILPHSIGWSITGLAVNPVMLLTGRLIQGIAQGGTTVAAMTYIIEIAEKSIRGMLAIITQIAIALGFFIVVNLNLVFHYYHFAYLGVTFSIISFLLDISLPESPLYLVINGREDEAKNILLKLRGPNFEVEQEIINLKRENEYFMNISVFENIRQPQVLKSLIVVITVFLIQNMCGLYIFYFNATRIIVDSTSNTPSAIDERLAVIYSFTFQLAGTVLALSYIDRIGRKKSIIMSLMLVALFNFILGSYDILNKDKYIHNYNMTMNSTTTETEANIMDQTDSIVEENNSKSSALFWIPVVCVMGTMFSASLGVEPVPWILNVEYFPTLIRSQANAFCTVWANIFAITILQLYSPMQNALSSAGLYFFYGSCSVVGAAFCFIFVIETKGISVG